MYAELGRWRDVIKVRKLMKQCGVIKQPGCSWIEIGSQMHVFLVKDKRHSQKREIHLLLKLFTSMMKLSGYAPNIGDLNADEEQNKAELTMLQELEMPLVAAGLIIIKFLIKQPMEYVQKFDSLISKRNSQVLQNNLAPLFNLQPTSHFGLILKKTTIEQVKRSQQFVMFWLCFKVS
ncbi:Pentatricopeptide repeat-containing protein [Abeliophyllum distichum]|uniref:Pentatricopeptide repeat-containing protein n=1 Tax=Abeliophyllum distichum TaxID=126358 RepID=A0ABD1SCW6_9LAMI